MKPLVLGIAGGTGSGKTTVTERVIRAVLPRQVAVIPMDNYYKEQSHLSFKERAQVNYDHPSAFDTDLLYEQVQSLIGGQVVKMPQYSFTRHTHEENTIQMFPQPVIVLEGILILFEERLRELMDLKVYVDADPDVRFIRRLERDLHERGRSLSSVVQQYLAYVRPMHLRFVEPTKRYADVIIPHGGHNEAALSMLVSHIKTEVGA